MVYVNLYKTTLPSITFIGSLYLRPIRVIFSRGNMGSNPSKIFISLTRIC